MINKCVSINNHITSVFHNVLGPTVFLYFNDLTDGFENVNYVAVLYANDAH